MNSKKSESKSVLHCFFCRQDGHKIDECEALKETICPICKQNGHTKKKCPKFDDTYVQKLECRFCRSKNLDYLGHTSNNCPQLKTKQCTLCLEFGHLSRFCNSEPPTSHPKWNTQEPKHVSSSLDEIGINFESLNSDARMAIRQLSHHNQQWFLSALRYDPCFEAIESLVNIVQETNQLKKIKEKYKKVVLDEPYINLVNNCIGGSVKKLSGGNVVYERPLYNAAEEFKPLLIPNKNSVPSEVAEYVKSATPSEVCNKLSKIPDAWDDDDV